MITHVVAMKPRTDLSTRDREAFVEAFELAVRQIPVVRGVRVGRRVTHGALYEKAAPDAADFVILIDFDDLDGLKTYLRHPAHDAVSAHFNRLLDSGWVYDFETDGLARLRELAGLEGTSR